MATDFFEHQDSARRQTGRLIVLFVIAVTLIVLAVYSVTTLIDVSNASANRPAPAVLDPGRFALVATVVLLIITTGSLFKIAVLRDGGDAIARMLGGQLINPATTDLTERRLLNVVEEMALASGTPVPPVYVLDDEACINAFAAGFTPGDAVIAVSRGCLDHLTRDELQGVIGHEFSHILNGDMRLNLRLIGLIHGILVIALIGQLLFRFVSYGGGSGGRSRDRDSKDGNQIAIALLIMGVALFAIGSIGVLFGRIIKCAISRQREFLADASSVQFTRNPEGLAGALKKIGGLATGSRISNPNAEQACHMFFGQGVPSLSQLLATHPPLVERIRRIDPTFEGTFPEVPPGRTVSDLDEDLETEGRVSGLAAASRPSRKAARPLSPSAAVESVGTPTVAHVDYASTLIDTLPTALTESAREPFAARAVIYALLLDQAEPVRRTQIETIDRQSEPGTSDEVLRLWPMVEPLGQDVRISLVDMTFPALRRLSDAQYRTFRDTVEALVKADQQVSLFEYTLQRMLLRDLDRSFFRLRPPGVRFLTLAPVFDDASVLISTLARLGSEDESAVSRTFALGMDRLQRNHPGERVVALRPPEQCSLVAIDRALQRLAQSAPGVKKRVLDACATCIAADGVVTPGEGSLLRAIADSLDCPMPPLLGPSDIKRGGARGLPARVQANP